MTSEPTTPGRLATWRHVINTANLPEGMTAPDTAFIHTRRAGGLLVLGLLLNALVPVRLPWP